MLGGANAWLGFELRGWEVKIRVAGVENGSGGSRCVAGVRNGSKLGCRGSKMGGGGCKQVSRARKGVWVSVDAWWSV